MKRKCRRLNVKNFSHLICQNFKIDVWREIYDTWWWIGRLKQFFFHFSHSNKNFKKKKKIYKDRNIWLNSSIRTFKNIFLSSLFADLKLLREYIRLINIQLARGAEVTIRTLRNLSQLLKPALSLSLCRSWSESHRLDNYIIRCVSSLAWESTSRKRLVRESGS